MALAEGLTNLFNNKMLLQIMSGLGAGLNPAMAPLNQAVQQNISAQNFSKLLAGILGGGGKMNVDSKGMKLDVPSSALGTIMGKPSDIQGSMEKSAAQQLTGIESITPQSNPFQLAL